MKHKKQKPPIEPLAVSGETAALLINQSAASLEKDRANGHLGIPFVQSGRRVTYLVSDLTAWLQSRRVLPDSGSLKQVVGELK